MTAARTGDRALPFTSSAEGRLHYRFDGPDHAPVLVLSNSLGTDLSLWDRQVGGMSGSFRILRYDVRGHGRSTTTAGPYSMDS